MAIQFCEIKKYIARNERISICLEDGSYISSSLFEKNVSEPDFEQTSCAVSKFAASTFSSHQFMQTSVKHTIVILI